MDCTRAATAHVRILPDRQGVPVIQHLYGIYGSGHPSPLNGIRLGRVIGKDAQEMAWSDHPSPLYSLCVERHLRPTAVQTLPADLPVDPGFKCGPTGMVRLLHQEVRQEAAGELFKH